MTRTKTLEQLVVTSGRLVRLAAAASGNATPSAVWRTLSILESEGTMRVGELAAASRVSQPGMTRLLGGMDDDGLITRTADLADSRALLVGITPAGRAALTGWKETIAQTLEPWFRDLGDGEWAALERTVAILTERTASTTASTTANPTETPQEARA